MLSHYFYPIFSGEEHLAEKIYKHWMVLVPAGIWMSLALLALFLVSSLFSVSHFGIVFFVGIPVIAIYGASQWLKAKLDCCFITNMRIINVQQKGLFHKKVEEVPLDKIEQVTYEIQGFWRSCFNIGNLRVKSRLQDEEICVMGIRNPHKAQTTIMKLQRGYNTLSNNPVVTDTMDQLLAAINGSRRQLAGELLPSAKGGSHRRESPVEGVPGLWEFILKDYVEMKTEEKNRKEQGSFDALEHQRQRRDDDGTLGFANIPLST